MNDSGSLPNADLFSGGTAAATLDVGGIMDLTSGTWQNLGKLSVSMGSNSLLIVPQGFNTATGFAHYTSLGVTCTAGNTINVAAGHSVVGCGFIDNFVSCQGSLIGIPGDPFSETGSSLTLESGLMLSGTGVVNLGNGGSLANNDFVSGMSGGSLTASSQVVGYGGSGSFTQTGGVSEPGELFLGSNLGKGGYSLSGTGQLIVGWECLGFEGVGSFTQSGGTNNSTSIYVGYIAGGGGSYSLSGGLALATQEQVGVSSSGLFTQSGGTNSISTELDVGNDDLQGPPTIRDIPSERERPALGALPKIWAISGPG